MKTQGSVPLAGLSRSSVAITLKQRRWQITRHRVSEAVFTASVGSGRAWAGGEDDVCALNRLAAFAAGQDSGEVVAAAPVGQSDRWSAGGPPSVSPGEHGQRHGIQVPSL